MLIHRVRFGKEGTVLSPYPPWPAGRRPPGSTSYDGSEDAAAASSLFICKFELYIRFPAGIDYRI